MFFQGPAVDSMVIKNCLQKCLNFENTHLYAVKLLTYFSPNLFFYVKEPPKLFFLIPRNRKVPLKIFFLLFQGTPTSEDVYRTENTEAAGITLMTPPCGENLRAKIPATFRGIFGNLHGMLIFYICIPQFLAEPLTCFT